MSSESTSDPHGHVMAIIGALGVPTAVIIGGVLAVLLLLNIAYSPSRAAHPNSGPQETPELGSHVVPQ